MTGGSSYWIQDLLRKGLYSDVIYKFEQPNLPFGLSGSQRTAEMLRFQSDPNNLTAYVTALKESGRGTEVANRLGKVFGQETSFPFSKDRPLAAGAAASADVEQQLETPLSSKAGREGPRLSSPSPMSGSEKPFWVSTPLAEWQKRIEEQQRDGGRGAFSPRSSQMPSPPPIPVIVTETFSWGKLFWKIGSVLLWWFLIMSSVGILMEQQGIGKSSKFPSHERALSNKNTNQIKTHPYDVDIFSEVEPTDDPNKKILFKDVQGVDEAKAELEEVVDFLKGESLGSENGGTIACR